eukprot:11701109-Alexandrium_andersonii.AAC.1
MGAAAAPPRRRAFSWLQREVAERARRGFAGRIKGAASADAGATQRAVHCLRSVCAQRRPGGQVQSGTARPNGRGARTARGPG